MEKTDAVIALFADHKGAEAAVKQLAAAGFDLKSLSVVGKGYHIDEKVIGFYNSGDRIKFWGTRGAFWGGLWGLLFGGVFVSAPIVGSVIILGYLASAAISALEGAALVGSISALEAALYSLGIPRDSVLRYQTDLAADGFLVMAHVEAGEVDRARDVLDKASPARIDVHPHQQGQIMAQPVVGTAG